MNQNIPNPGLTLRRLHPLGRPLWIGYRPLLRMSTFNHGWSGHQVWLPEKGDDERCRPLLNGLRLTSMESAGQRHWESSARTDINDWHQWLTSRTDIKDWHQGLTSRTDIKDWHQGLTSRTDIKDWHQGLTSRTDIKDWHQGLTSRTDIKDWHQGLTSRTDIKDWHQGLTSRTDIKDWHQGLTSRTDIKDWHQGLTWWNQRDHTIHTFSIRWCLDYDLALMALEDSSLDGSTGREIE